MLAVLIGILRHANEQETRRNLLLPSRRLSISATPLQPLQHSTDDEISLSIASSPEPVDENNNYDNKNDASSSSSSSTEQGHTYLIIHYHKSGYTLTQNLRDILLQIDPSIQRNYIDRFPKREHDTLTKCPHFILHPNTIYVQSSPDFFCDIDILAEMLLTRPFKKSVKIIHLVRNPFTMAISNYKYHSQNPLPDGENWVKRTNPCAVIDKSSVIYANLFMRTLTTGIGVYRLMEYDDFNIIQQVCHQIYDTLPNLPGFYTHLLQLQPVDGLVLATTYLMLGHGGDIVRMANNVIKLRQLQLLEQQIQIHQHTLHLSDSGSRNSKEMKRIQVMTMSMDDFIGQPKLTTMKFLDFVSSSLSESGNHVILSNEKKQEIATRYEEMYYEKVNAGDEHITSLISSSSKKRMNSDNNGTTLENNNEETAAGGAVIVSDDVVVLEMSLRENVLFGRVLGNIENLVQEALGGVHNWY
jgi:hypothetical protein